MSERLLEETAEELYEEAPCGYLTTRPDGRILRVNRTFTAWTGHDRDILLEGRRFQDLLTAGGRVYHETHLAPLLQMQDAVSEIALEIACRDGRRLPVLVNASLKRDGSGEPLLVRITVFNATDRREYERELLHSRRAERQAREGVEHLQRMTSRLSIAPDAEQVGRVMLSELARVVEVHLAAFAVGDDAGALRIVATHGIEALAPTAAALSEALARAPAPMVVEEAGSGVRVLLVLASGGRQLGLAWVQLMAGTPLRDHERALLESGARQCAQALERVRLQEATAAAAARTAFLADLAQALDRDTGLQPRATALVERLVPAAAAGALLHLPAGADGEEPLEVARGELGEDAAVLALSVGDRSLGELRVSAGADAALLTEVADRAAVALENARLHELDRTIAHTLQRSLLDVTVAADRRYAIATHYEAGVRSLEVGGDWHDAFAVADGVVGLVIGDVVGRGLHAASAMGQLRSALRALAAAELGPGQVFERLDVFVEQVEAAQMATAAYAEVEFATGAVRYAVAGHPPPVRIPDHGEPRLLLDGRSAPLGAYASRVTRPEGRTVLAPGERLLLYTDGVVERRTEPIDEGLDRLMATVSRHAGEPGAQLIEAVRTELIPGEPDDDACLLCFERLAA